MNNDPLYYEVYRLDDAKLVPCPENQLYHYSQNIYRGKFPLTIEENALVLESGEEDKKLLVVEPEHFQCPHGVSIVETESSLVIVKAAVLQNECFFIGENSHLYMFNMIRNDDAGVFKAEKVLKLKNKFVRDIRAGENHVIALVEQFNCSSARVEDRLDAVRGSLVAGTCKRCRDDRELRMSILQLEADRKASDTEQLLLDDNEIDNLRNSMVYCLQSRTLPSNRASDVLARPSSLSSLPELSRKERLRAFSSINCSQNSFNFLSMDTIDIESKRQEYEKQPSTSEGSTLINFEVSTEDKDDVVLPPSLEVWVWGDNGKGQLGLPNLELRSAEWIQHQTILSVEPTQLQAFNERAVRDISCGNNHCTVVTAIGELYVWGCRSASESFMNLKLSPLKVSLNLLKKEHFQLGPEQFVFRCESIGDNSYFLVISRDCKSSLYCWSNGAVRRIPQTNKDQCLINIYVLNDKVYAAAAESAKSKLLFVFKNFQQIRLIKGFSDICDTIHNLFTHEFDPENVEEKEREVLIQLCRSTKKFYEALCSIQGKILNNLNSSATYTSLLKIFNTQEFSACFDDFVLRFCVDDSYRTLLPETTTELNKQVNRLALEFNVDSNGISSQLRNLVLEALSFFSFLSSRATKYIQDCQNEGDREIISDLLSKWRKKNVFLHRLVTSTKKTKQEAWSNVKLTWLKVPRRFLADVFRVGDGQKIKQITVEQPRFYLHKILAIYIFHDLFVTEEVRGYKNVVKCCPLSLVWLERSDEDRLSVLTPEAQYCIEFNDDLNWFSLCCGSWSDILMEGNPVPVTRQGQFEFGVDCPREHLRLKTYTGSWRMGRLCGKGKLVDPKSGDTEDGMFIDDVLHGFGQVFKTSPMTENRSTFYISSTYDQELQNKDFYRGVFEKGELNGLSHISYANNFCYNGFTKNGIPNGFGVMTWANESMLGEFVNGSLNEENMLGELLEGKLHGRGITINLDGNVCEGEWENGKMKRGKILTTSHDGSFPLEYEGETDQGDSNFGIGKQGRLRVSKDAYLEGSFTGNIIKRDIKVVEASLCSNEQVSPLTTMLSSTGPFPASWAVPVQHRWKVFFDTFLKEKIGLDTGGEDLELVRNIWSKIVIGMTRGKLLVHGDVSTGFCDALEKIPSYDDHWSLYYYNIAAEYWRLSQDNEYHPLRRLMNGIVEIFTSSYSGISAHAVMYSYCVLEAKHLLVEVMLFPNFPESAYEHGPKDTETPYPHVISSPESSPEKSAGKKNVILVPTPCSDFIAENFFGRCSPILFTIYSLHNVEREERYWNRAMYLNAHTDVKLLTHLEVNRDLWPIAISSKNTRDLDRPIIVTTARDKFYRKAVDRLQRLPSETNPSSKLRLLAETYNAMEQCVAEQTEIGSRHVFTADSLLPAFIYVVVRAQIRHLGSEILFLDDFSREWRGEGAIGLLFTNLQSAYMYICNERSLV